MSNYRHGLCIFTAHASNTIPPVWQVLGLSLDDEEEGLVSDDTTISSADKEYLIKLHTELFMDFSKLILGVYRY